MRIPALRFFFLSVALLVAGPVVGCGEVEPDAPDAGRVPGRDAEADPDDGGLIFVTDDGGGIDAGARDTGGGNGGPDAACVTASAQAELVREPVDIILAVDNSSSMREEVANTNRNLNEFASIIEKSQIDYRVVMIAKRGTNDDDYPFEVCIPPPLADLNCANGPRFMHVDEEIFSTKVLKQILNTYQGIFEGPKRNDPKLSWKGFLRPNARKHFVAITDDDATTTQADATKFDATMKSWAPMFNGYVFNAICGLEVPACSTAAHIGTNYIKLAKLTGGQQASICEKDWRALFTKLAQGVVSSTKLSCEFDVPPPPPGKVLLNSKVSVVYTPGGGAAAIELGRVDGAAQCGSEPGFYYDNNTAPKKIIICPQTCPTLQGDSGGKIDVMFACGGVLN